MSSGFSADLQKLSSLWLLSYLNEWNLALHVCFICRLLLVITLRGSSLPPSFYKDFFPPNGFSISS